MMTPSRPSTMALAAAAAAATGCSLQAFLAPPPAAPATATLRGSAAKGQATGQVPVLSAAAASAAVAGVMMARKASVAKKHGSKVLRLAEVDKTWTWMGTSGTITLIKNQNF
eukprot:s206_g1.t1